VQCASILLVHIHTHGSRTVVPMLPERMACIVPTRVCMQPMPGPECIIPARTCVQPMHGYCMSFLSWTFVVVFLPSSRSLCSLGASLICCLTSLNRCPRWAARVLEPLDLHCNLDYNLCPDCEILRMAWNKGCVPCWVLRSTWGNGWNMSLLTTAWCDRHPRSSCLEKCLGIWISFI
jgi:hypothetical protein